MRFAYLPKDAVTNKYVTRFVENIGVFGDVDDLISPWSFFKQFGFRINYYDVIFLNWIENDYLHKESGRFSYYLWAKSICKIFFYKIIAKRVVSIRHNWYPHAVNKSDINLVLHFSNLTEKLFDTVFVHSRHAAINGRVYIPHPLYTVVDKDINILKKLNIDGLSYYVLFGRIMPYKNIESLIDSFPDSLNLVIFGSCNDYTYVESLNPHNKSNIFIYPGFYSEAESQTIIKNSMGLIISHNETSMIVSGSFFYAISIDVGVLVLESLFFRTMSDSLKSSSLNVFKDIKSLCDELEMNKEVMKVCDEDKKYFLDEFGDKLIQSTIKQLFIN